MQKSSSRRLFDELSPFKLQVFFIFLLGLIVSSVQPYSINLSQKIIDSLQNAQKNSNPSFQNLALKIVITFLLGGIAKYFYQTIRRILNERILFRCREKLFKKYLSFTLSYLDNKKSAELLSVLQNDLVQMGQGLETITDLIKEPFTFLGLLAVAFYCDWKLTLLVLAIAPLVIFLFSWSGKLVKSYSRKNLADTSRIFSLGQESIFGSRVIKIFGLQEELISKFKKVHEQYFSLVKKSIGIQEIATPAVELVGAVIMVGVVLYGNWRITQGTMTVGQLVSFTISIGLIQMPLKKLNNAFLKIRMAEAAAERIYAVLDAPDTEKTKFLSHKVELTKPIRFENVALSYQGNPVLNNINFEVQPGNFVAFIGKSGGGKSSLVNLLPRFYEHTMGEIFVEGKELRDWDLSELRALISYVTQDTFLFNDTIFENIRYGKPKASAEEIFEAAELAYCTDFVKKLPHQFNTVVGDRGVLLSGGEKQRIAMARAILKDAPILILDEATSNLDSESEKKVQSALEKISIGKTTLVVAHRLSTIEKADKVYLVEKGCLTLQYNL